MQIAPPSITKPFSTRGSTTRMNGGAKGKLSGKIKCSRMWGIFNSTMSWASGESGSMWKSRTCHSNKLSLINSTCSKNRKQKILILQGHKKKFIKIGFVYNFTAKNFSLCGFWSSRNSFINRLDRIVVSTFGAMGSFDLTFGTIVLLLKERKKYILIN